MRNRRGGVMEETRRRMNKDTLSAMLRRRGYTPIWDGSALHVRHLTGWLILPAVSIPARTRTQWAKSIDDELGMGSRHVRCRDCHSPLLYAVGGTGTSPGATHWEEYRVVEDGPLSAPVATCPGCGVALLPGQTETIDDDEEDG